METVKLSAIEQWNIDERIKKSRRDCNCQPGQTVLCLLRGGLSENWQEVAHEEAGNKLEAVETRQEAKLDPRD